MVAEYTPEFNLATSQAKLQNLADTQVEVSEQALHEGILDVLASRGGERWKKLDEIYLGRAKTGMRVYVGFREPRLPDEPYPHAFMQVDQLDGKHLSYQVRNESGGVCELAKVDFTTGSYNPVSNLLPDNPAAARLLSILADAHSNSPIEQFGDDAYGP